MTVHRSGKRPRNRVYMSGYIFHLKRSRDWHAPDDDWETVVRSVHGNVVGQRQIDGSNVVVVRSGDQFYAALSLHVEER